MCFVFGFVSGLVSGWGLGIGIGVLGPIASYSEFWVEKKASDRVLGSSGLEYWGNYQDLKVLFVDVSYSLFVWAVSDRFLASRV